MNFLFFVNHIIIMMLMFIFIMIPVIIYGFWVRIMSILFHRNTLGKDAWVLLIKILGCAYSVQNMGFCSPAHHLLRTVFKSSDDIKTLIANLEEKEQNHLQIKNCIIYQLEPRGTKILFITKNTLTKPNKK